MKITILTLFPGMFEGFLNESIVKKAQEKNLLDLEIIDIRNFTTDKHNSVDDRPYGGGAGMVLMAEPVINAIKNAKKSTTSENKDTFTLLTSPRGAVFNQRKAQELSNKKHLIIVAGHYEAVDERALSEVDEEVSIGDYVLTGGELPAAVIADAVTRLIPNVLKKSDATEIESFYKVSLDELAEAVGEHPKIKELASRNIESVQLLEYPHYTRPQSFNGEEVPDVLLSGHHSEIKRWQLQKSFEITLRNRPDLLES